MLSKALRLLANDWDATDCEELAMAFAAAELAWFTCSTPSTMPNMTYREALFS